MSNLKVLPLENWITSDFWNDDDGDKELPMDHHFIGRDGKYLQGDFCWYEYKGKMYSSSVSSFKYTLALYLTPLVRTPVYESLRTLQAEGFPITKEQHMIMYKYCSHYTHLRQRVNTYSIFKEI